MPQDSFLTKLSTAQSEKKRFTIYLSNETAKKLKIYAAQTGKKMSDIVEDALSSKLKDVKTF